MNMDTLEVRRESLCLKFAKACVRNEKMSDMFPRNVKNHLMEKRGREVFYVRRAKTERLRCEKISSNKHAKIIKQRCIRKERHSQKNK